MIWLRWLAWVIIFGTHIWLIMTGAGMTATQTLWHSILNIGAAIILWFMR